ncbi:response regulator transcription factor [Robertkochia flava]|uniref:response regulator transcription factor n=1 Tax=Robertkochia flava TaxID=3447986 RepID=UPI001CC9AB8B|nr:helix-turn-helix transcriptional regulator [Robertkochia marina]
MDSTEIIQYWESKYASNEVMGNNFNLEPFLHGFLAAFSPGHSYYYVANFKSMTLPYVAESVVDFVGKKSDKVTFQDIVATAHQDQVEMVRLKEQVIYDFYFNFLPREDVNRFKAVYLYKMQDPKGRTRVMLQQALPLNLDASGNLENALSVHTDVSYLRIQPDHTISFFSLKGSQSFLNVNSETGRFDPESIRGKDLLDVLTPREREIVGLLAKGLSSKEVSVQLHVSVHTVQKHRKNILQKTNCSNTSELVSNCIMAGLFV